MEQFPIYPLIGSGALPKNFVCKLGDTIDCSFSAYSEREIDAVITALICVRSLLREKVKPIPKSNSLVCFMPINEVGR